MPDHLFCPKCGFTLKNVYKFCPKCGLKSELGQDFESRSQPVEKMNQTEKDKSNASYAPIRPPVEPKPIIPNAFSAKKGSNKLLYFIAVIFVGVLLLIGNAVIFDSKDKSPTSVALNSPAVSFFNPGEAYVTVTQVWGIPMYDGDVPRPLMNVLVDMYQYLQDSTGGSPITMEEVERAFLPGRSLHSIFNRLVSDPFIYDLIYEGFLEIAKQRT